MALEIIFEVQLKGMFYVFFFHISLMGVVEE